MREKEILLGKEGVGVVGVTSAPQTVPPGNKLVYKPDLMHSLFFFSSHLSLFHLTFPL